MTIPYLDRPFVGVSLPSLIYVGIIDRAAFDRIDRPMSDYDSGDEHVLVKRVEQDGCTVIFQHWLKVKPL